MKLNEDQLTAIQKAKGKRFSIITGGAGTGKTTLIKSIVDEIPNSTLLCPTGKAAARLRESSGLPAATVHSELRYDGNRFMRGKFSGETIIIDEASMMDSWLLSSIIEREPLRLVLVGDQAQLPPVGAGAPFHDLIDLRPDLCTELNICYRNKEAVFKAAMAIRRGEKPLPEDRSDGEYWRLVNTGTPEASQQFFIDKILSDLDFEQDLVITPRNGKPLEGLASSVHSLNEEISKRVNPKQGEIDWEIGDRIICQKNFSALDTWNGTTGTVIEVEPGRNEKANAVTVKGDIPFNVSGEPQPEMRWTREQLRHCQQAYALTVHKSQGSQYRKVVVFALQRDAFNLLSRSLIYTAVTRAKQECHVLGHVGAFVKALRETKQKRTVLQELAKQENQ